MSRVNVIGLVLNTLAIIAALAAFPFLLIPLMKAAFVGLLVNAPAALAAVAIGVVVIDLGPIVGMVLSITGRAKALAIATGPVSLVSLILLFAGARAVGLDAFTERGRNTAGPTPGCTPKNPDGSALGRRCDRDAGPAPAGNCPAEYWCMEKLVGHPETNECMIYCSNECECPAKHKCVFEKCVPK